MIDYGLDIALGPISPSMADTMRDWRNDIRIRSWCRQIGVLSEFDQDRWMQAQSNDKTLRMFSVHHNRDFVGVAGLTSIDMVNRRAEFSLYIGPNSHGLGFGKRALRTLCRFGFEELGLNSIWGESFEGNPAIKMFYDVGFVKEGVRRQFYFKGGMFIDAVLVSIQRHELKLL